MTTQAQIKAYINSLPSAKADDIKRLDALIKKLQPKCKLWFLDGKNAQGKVVSNPNIGYGSQVLGTEKEPDREFYQIGLSATAAGLSVYILGIKDKTFLQKNFGKTLGKADITGYCIKFKKLSDINSDVLTEVLKFGLGAKN